jgi:hypothetical protein
VSVFYHLPSYKNPQASGRNRHVFCAGYFEEGIAMALPKRVWFTLHEVAARWGCNIADIAGWADAGHFCIITGVTPIRSGAEIVAGKVALAPMDILPLFRRCGTGPSEGRIRRVQLYGREEWLIITEPEGGIMVAIVDMMISTGEVQRFEDAYNVFDRGSDGAGLSEEGDYDWAAMNIEITRRVFEEGLPASQNEMIRELQDWFAARSEDGTFPDERSIRRRLKPILDALRFKRPKR